MKKKDQLRAVVLIALLLILVFLFLKNPVPGSKPGASTPAGGSSSSVSKSDANGVAWSLDQAGGGSLLSTEPNAPKAGAPIVVKTDVQKVADREVSIGLLLEGQAGEQYKPMVKRNGTPVAAPRLRIVNEAGQVMAQDSFQYG
jgi:hypothetical protein